uniref:Kinesin-like protein n=1 Tax=Cuerna arida TaxID=1464854 RepID=A0A1B6FS76_9HEMI
MVLNKRDLERAFSPKNKPRKLIKNNNDNHRPKMLPDAASNVKVFVRVRPLSEREQSHNQRSTIKVIDDRMLIFDPKEETEGFFFHGVKQKTRDIAKRTNKEMQFIFDRVFSSDANNMEVYEGTTEGIISNILEGYNCSVFVYGATGAGKTHTMLGNKESPGITFLTMTELYKQVEQLKATKDVEIGITYLEVYNENVQDLINPSGPMHLRDDSNGGVLVAGMKVEKILCSEQLFQLLQRGNSNRTQHPTDANAESSRSHAVFQVYVKIQTKVSGEVKISKLSMIDLAGSERGSATGCVGARFKEGSNINKSLLALGNCINNLADGLRHIPYRDSKLTRLLKDSLGGNCHTVMIANVSPSTSSYEDTYNTLKYATRAKSIKSKLSKNVMSVKMGVEHYARMCDALKKENASLKEQVRVMDRALKQPAVSPPRADPKYVEKLNSLYRDKKQIHSEWLSLDAQLKLLQWRIRCKSLAASQMESQMSLYGADYNQELIKNEKSLSQLKARANSVIGKMTELWHQKNQHTEEYNKFTEEMEEAKVTKLLQTEANLKELQCEVAGMAIQQAHHQKIINMQEKRLEDYQSVVDSVTKICSEYHMILRGLNLITDTMDNEYQVGFLKMKGLKTVTWMDMEDGSDDEEGATLSSVSVRPFTTLQLPSTCSMPIVVPELRVKTSENAPVICSSESSSAESVTSDLNGTFVFEPTDTEPSTNVTSSAVVKTGITNFTVPKMPPRAVSKISTKKYTPARVKFSGNKENSLVKPKINPKYLCPTPVRPKSALASRQVNIQELKTPETKVSVTGLKMTREKERVHHSQHPYIRPIKLKRLGSTPVSTTKSAKGLKL